MQERLQFLLEDQRIRRLNADLKPGLRPGEAVLTATVEERLPYKLWLQVDNYQAPAVGAERGIMTLEHQNLTGWGDILTFKYGRSDGLDPMFDIRYAVPVTPWDTLLSFQWRKNSFSVVDKEFRDLDIESESEIYTFTLRHPVYRTLNTEVALEVIGEHLSHHTTLLGEPFTLAPGAVNGESVVSAVRTAQEVVHRTQNQVLAFRSRLSWGVDVLDATIHRGDEPDSQFFAWLGQFQAVRRLPFLDTQAILRSDVQLTPDRLLVLEQMAIGGRYSVRGYRENTFVRDNAVVGSLEIRVPVVRNVRWADYFQVAPFFDYGHAWNTREIGRERHSIYSVGVGLRWGLTIPGLVELRPQFEIYWGHALRDIRSAEGGDPQDDGIHFQFVLGVF
jgi:hemolysin activation/secretion protein